MQISVEGRRFGILPCRGRQEQPASVRCGHSRAEIVFIRYVLRYWIRPVSEEDTRVGAQIPSPPTLGALRDAAARCTACDLYKNATQTVFGEGPEEARVMLVGEQPGDAEDLAGHPFVGPAGRLLDRCLIEGGIDRQQTYVTNVVKHFNWVPRGPRRIHSKPGAVEIEACFPWLEAEISVVKPQIVVALGATAAQALFGKAFRVTRDRGRLVPFALASCALATVHPSALLRAPDEATRRGEIDRFIEDLRQVAAILAGKAR
jgi:uracil-DNA glycosylase family protein